MVNVSSTPTLRPAASIRWGRVVIAALLLEVALLVILVPVMMVVDSPFSGAPEGDHTVFFVSVTVACFVVGVAAGMWVARGVSGRPLLHGALVGIVATAMYLALCAVQPGGIAAVAAGYGMVAFVALNTLRIAGATAGATLTRKPSH
jgi:hypothetical protein